VAIFTTVALDVSGVISATLLALAGWLILPARRRRLVRELEAKIAQLDADLAALLSASFKEQLGRHEEQLLEVIAPYERFLAVEGERVGRALGELRAAEQEVAALEQRIDAALPEGQPARE